MIVLVCALMVASCEDESDSSDPRSEAIEAEMAEEAPLITLICSVLQVNNFGLQPGDLKTYDCSGNKRIVFTSETGAVKQRSSCSGFDVAEAGDIEIGNILSVTYFKDDVNYGVSPPIFRATFIEAYKEECIGTLSPEEDGGSECPTCAFFN